MRFLHPEPPKHDYKIYPVFIPFAGCKIRCLFCAQNLQTGQQAQKFKNQIKQVEEYFKQSGGKQVLDLAFYGGTFTALPQEEQEAYLAMAAKLREQGLVRQIRCSTRPDAVNPQQLKRLLELGLDFIELGVQSFCSEPLAASLRGYTGETAHLACKMVLESGMGLGIQLMPGMPQQSPKHFAEDIKICLELKPEAVRLYPCLVISGTGLSACWERGYYTPWSLEETLEALSPAVLDLWECGIKTIRMGLAPEEGLLENILAGPYHPALGQCVRSRALYLFLRKILATENGSKLSPGKRLFAPKRVQGEFFGHKGNLKTAYANMGLSPENITWWNNNHFELKDF